MFLAFPACWSARSNSKIVYTAAWRYKYYVEKEKIK